MKTPAWAVSMTCRACPSTPRITGRPQAMNSSIFVGITVSKTLAFLSKTRQTSEARMIEGIFSPWLLEQETNVGQFQVGNQRN